MMLGGCRAFRFWKICLLNCLASRRGESVLYTRQQLQCFHVWAFKAGVSYCENCASEASSHGYQGADLRRVAVRVFVRARAFPCMFFGRGFWHGVDDFADGKPSACFKFGFR